MDDKVRFNCLISPDLFKKIEQRADQLGLTKTALIISAINNYLSDSEESKQENGLKLRQLESRVDSLESQINVIMALLAKNQSKG